MMMNKQNTMLSSTQNGMPSESQYPMEKKQTIHDHDQDLTLPGRKDAQLLMQKRSTIPENNDKIKFDSLNMKTKKPRKTHNMRSRSHHHHELTDLHLDKNIKIRKDVLPLQNSSVLRDFLMQKIKVFSRVKLGKRKRIEPKESWKEFHDSTTIANKEVNEQYMIQDADENHSSISKYLQQPSATTLVYATTYIIGEQHPSKVNHHGQVWHQHKRSSKQDQFLLVEETTTSVNRRKNSEQSLEGKTNSQEKHKPNFGLGGIASEKYNDESQKIYFPLNIKETVGEPLDIQVDDPSINKSPVNATKDLYDGGPNLNTEYLDEYDDLTGPYISKELISQNKALNRNLVSKSIFMDDSLNEQTENISKTELIDSHAGQNSISISSVVGIGLGAVMFLLILSVLSATLFYKKQYLRKAESMDKSFVSCDSYSGSYADSETFNSISYADCAGIEIAKDNSSEELYNLDNDSFLNSLEAISFPEYWTDKL